MTRSRVFGSDTDFCAWHRKHADLQATSNLGMTLNDIDVLVHRYVHCRDKIGTRDIQCLMHLEVKTRNGEPQFAQRDSFCKLNLFRGDRRHKRMRIINFGVFFLSMSHTSPDNSTSMRWGRFTHSEEIEWRTINESQLLRLLRFDVDPSTLEPLQFRRHHKTRETIERRVMPLGFATEVRVTHRS